MLSPYCPKREGVVQVRLSETFNQPRVSVQVRHPEGTFSKTTQRGRCREDVGESRTLDESSAVSGVKATTVCRWPGHDRSVTQIPKGHLRGPLEFRLC
jgi:hypothetical protein